MHKHSDRHVPVANATRCHSVESRGFVGARLGAVQGAQQTAVLVVLVARWKRVMVSDVIGVAYHRAVKVHHCCWCRERIRPGEVYERWMAKDAADVWTLKAHPECVEAMQEIHRRAQLFSDESACYRTDHDRGRGCEECDPSGTVGLP